VVLAGGLSKRFGGDKCVMRLGGKPLVAHVFERVSKLADECVVVVGSEASKDALSSMLGGGVSVVVDRFEGQSPLVGALSGFERVRGEYALLVPCDAPFVSAGVVGLLFDLCVGRGAVVPRWPNGFVEPLLAVYRVGSAVAAGRAALEGGKRDMVSLIVGLRRVRYVSTLVLRGFDPGLLSFFNVNTLVDLRRAESMISKGEKG